MDITTNNFEAEFGRAVGTVVNVTLKSGTNQFPWLGLPEHGKQRRQCPQILRHPAPNGRLVYNYTGGSIGGPVVKNKLFLFGDFLRVSDHEEAATTTTIPYYHVVNGNIDLSAYKGQIYDPNTDNNNNSNSDPGYCSGAKASNTYCGVGRTAFVNNQIPLTHPLISAVGKKVLSDLATLASNPAKNLNAAMYNAAATSNNYSANLPFHKDMISYDIKSDYTMSSKDHLSGRFSHQNISIFRAPLFGSFLGGPALSNGYEATGTATPIAPVSTMNTPFRTPCSPKRALASPTFAVSATQTDDGTSDANTLGIPGNGPNGTDNSADEQRTSLLHGRTIRVGHKQRRQ